jgi:D-serine deaminase-like pyridoxal phosphate-dependent protein
MLRELDSSGPADESDRDIPRSRCWVCKLWGGEADGRAWSSCWTTTAAAASGKIVRDIVAVAEGGKPSEAGMMGCPVVVVVDVGACCCAEVGRIACCCCCLDERAYFLSASWESRCGSRQGLAVPDAGS